MNDLSAKLRQRRVLQWCLAYLASAWVLLQVLGFLFQTFHWPERFLQGATVFLAVAFIAAPFIAWFHGEAGKQRFDARQVGVVVIIVALALVSAGFVATRSNAERPLRDATDNGAGDTMRSVVVLPFINSSGDPNQEFFSDGMTDELAHALTKIPALRVASRTSSYSFKGKQITAPEIGHALNVAYVIAGTVRRSGRNVRITTELTSTRNDSVTFSHEFKSSDSSTFKVQDDFTREVIAALMPRLGAAAATLAKDSRGTENQEAYEDFLKGKFYWAKRGGANLLRAADFFKKAIDHDPAFARGHAALSMAYGVLPGYAVDTADVYPSLAMASAKRAMELDSTSAESSLAMAGAMMAVEDYVSAEAAARRVIRTDPSNATAHQWLGEIFLALGRTDEAVVQMQRAAAFDSLSPIIWFENSLSNLYARRFGDAEAAGRKAIALDPGVSLWTWSLALPQIFDGKADSAILILEHDRKTNGISSGLRASMVLAYATAGRWVDAARVRDELRRDKTHDPQQLEASYADMVFGDNEPLLQVLLTANGRRLFQLHSFEYMACLPLIDPLRKDPRYQEVLRSVGAHDCTYTSPWPVKSRPAGNIS